MNEKTGRTFWDVVSENRRATFLLAIFIVAIFGYAIYNKYKITISNFSVKPPIASTAKGNEGETEPLTPVKKEITPKKPAHTEILKGENTEPQVKLENSNNYIYTGNVVDNNSKAMAEVEVKWGDQIVKTSANGTFYLKMPKSIKEPRIILSNNGKSSPIIENPSGTIIVFSPN